MYKHKNVIQYKILVKYSFYRIHTAIKYKLIMEMHKKENEVYLSVCLTLQGDES